MSNTDKMQIGLDVKNYSKELEKIAKKLKEIKSLASTKALSEMLETIQKIGSTSLNKVFEPLEKVIKIKDKISKVIEKIKELKSTLTEATHTNGKFDFGKAFKFGTTTAGLLVVSALYQQFTDHLSKNEDAQKKWNEIISIGKEILNTVVQIILEFILALFGFNKSADISKNKSEMFNKVLDKTKDIIEKLKEKIEQLREWVNQNRDAIHSWGERLKYIVPIIISLFIIFKLTQLVYSLIKGTQMLSAALSAIAGNLVVLAIIAIVVAVMLLIEYFKYLYNTNEEFRAAIDRAWNAIKKVFSIVWEEISKFFQGFIDYCTKLWTENEGLRIGVETIWSEICNLFIIVSDTIGSILATIINTFLNFFSENEKGRQIIESVWSFIKDHIITIISILLGGVFGLFIGIIIEFLTKNEEAREVIAKVWTGIKEVIKTSIDGIITYIDLLTYRIQEVSKSWEALKNGNFSEAKKHALNAVSGEGFEAYKKIRSEERELETARKQAIKNAQQINDNIQKEVKKITPAQKETIINSGKGIDTKSVVDSTKTDEKVRSSIETIEIQKQQISQEWLDNWYKFIDSQTTTISNLLTQWGAFFTNLQNLLTLTITLMTILWSLHFITITLMLTTMNITATSVIETLKIKFNELSLSLIPFINKLAEAGEKLNFLKLNSNLGISINSYSVACACAMKTNATGTNHFSGGLTSINERGDELLIAPNGTVIANNPSTTNIMRDLLLVKTNLSHINFKMGNNGNESPKNNITINIGNISNRSDIDYMINQLSMLDMS